MSLEGVLLKLQKIFSELPLLESNAKHLAKYRERFLDPNRLLIMGEFSSGKSTLINTLLQKNILHTGAVPTTAVATYIRYSEEEFLEIVYRTGEVECTSLSNLQKSTSERNEQGKLLRTNIERINLYLCNDFLRDIVLIDTPGLNATNATHHYEQAINAYDEADDGLWIFKYGSVGSSTELKMLKVLQDKGLQPLGIINMIDEADSDDLTSYFAYELQKLEGRVRAIVGVSAEEAQEAIAEEDEELYSISGFPNLLNEIEKIKKDKVRKQQSFEKAFLIYWKKLIEDVESFLHSQIYIDSVEKLQQFLNDVKKENLELNKEWEIRERALILEQNILEKKVKSAYSLEGWILTDVHGTLREEYGEFKQWETTLQIFEQVRTANQIFLKEVSEFEKFFQTKIGKGNNFIAQRKLYKIARERKKELKVSRIQLIKEIKEINYGLNLMNEQLDELMPNILAYIEQQYVSLNDQIVTLSKEQAKRQEDNNKSIITAKEIVSDWHILINLREHLLLIQQYISRARLTALLSAKYLHEVELENTENEIQGLNSLIYKSSVETKNLNCMRMDISIPEQLDLPTKIPSHILYSFKPALLVVVIACAIYVFVMYKDDAKSIVKEFMGGNSPELSISENSFSDYTGEEYDTLDQTEEQTEEQTKDLFPYEQPNIEYSIGSIYDNNNQTPVYNRASENGEIVSYLDDLNYEVSHLTENGWMKVGEDAWVAYHDEIDFYQHELESALYTTNQSIRTEQVVADLIPVFESSTRESAVIGFLEDKLEIDIFEVPNSNWVNVGNNAWIEADKYLNIDWTFSPVAESDPIGEIEVLANNLNVRQEDNKESNLIGRVSGGDILSVYDISELNGWYSLGEYGWVSSDNKYVSYTSYDEEVIEYGESNYDDTLLEAPIGYVDVLYDIPLYDYSMNKTGELIEGTTTEVYEFDRTEGMYRINETDWLYADNENVLFYNY